MDILRGDVFGFWFSVQKLRILDVSRVYPGKHVIKLWKRGLEQTVSLLDILHGGRDVFGFWFLV